MPGRRFRIYSKEFKEAAVRRILAGEKIRAVADELRLRSQLLYTWFDLYEQGGADALVPRGRPRKAVAWARRRALVQQPSRQARAYGHAGREPARLGEHPCPASAVRKDGRVVARSQGHRRVARRCPAARLLKPCGGSCSRV